MPSKIKMPKRKLTHSEIIVKKLKVVFNKKLFFNERAYLLKLNAMPISVIISPLL